MQIIIEDNVYIKLAQVYEPQANALEKHFRVKDPNAHHSLSMKRGHWDGYYRFYKSSSQTLRKGYLKEVIELCIENDFPYDIIDRRPKSKWPVPAIGSFDESLIDVEVNDKKIKAHDHQMRCWESVCKASKHSLFEIGTHFHPTGGGKSLMMAGIVKLLRCPTVIITEQSIVLNQIVNSLRLFDVVHHNDIGEFYSGKMIGDNLVCVGSIAALQTPKKPIFAKFNVKVSTMNKDFDKMLKSDREKLESIMTKNGVLAYIRSCIIESIRQKSVSRSKKVRDSIKFIIDKKWDTDDDKKDRQIEQKVVDNINKNHKKLESIIDYAKYWNSTKTIENNYEKVLIKALSVWDNHLRKKYFDISMKGYQTSIKKSREIQNMVQNCELLLVDEMDNAASDNYNALFEKHFKGRYIHGFSGTPYDRDKPVAEMKLKGYFGPIISKSSRQELEEIGQIQPVKYYSVQFGEIDQKDKTAFDAAERDIIIDNKRFHQTIKTMIDKWPDEKHLIVVDTSNIEDLGKALEELLPNSIFIHGKSAVAKRNKAIADFENGDTKVLIVSKIGKRGMDLGGGADNMFLIGGGKGASNFDQIIGRAVRRNDRGWSRVFDFYFTGNHYLLKHSRKRLNYIVEMGYQANVMIGGELIEASKFIKSRYRLPNKLMIKK